MIGQDRRYYKTVDSTNTKAKEWAKVGANEGALVIADKQSNGKGRSGKVWDSPGGVGIWMSIILRPNLPLEVISGLTLVAGLAICKSIKKETKLDAKIKWPNDIVIQGKKVCGILCELHVSKNKADYAIVGIGVNVNTEHFPSDLPHASSLYLLSGEVYDRKKLIDSFCAYFEDDYKSFTKDKGLSGLREAYESHCITLGNKVKITTRERTYEASAVRISELGHLVVSNQLGEEEEITSGEVSVRGLYGYI